MASRGQSSYYPCNETAATLCSAGATCYAGSVSACSNPSYGSQQNTTPCPTCNTSPCNSSQAYCSIGYENITSHGDVGSFSFGAGSNQTIWKVWTAAKWNLLQDNYDTANDVGKVQKQGAGLSFTPATSDDGFTHAKSSLITAAIYNQFSTAASGFNSSIPAVTQNSTIKASHSTAIDSGYASSKFNTDVCDVCNAGSEHNCSYNCACNYNCSYNCGCNYNCSPS